MKDSPKLGTLLDWAKGDLNLEHFSEPSMVEPCHNLSLQEIVRDYSLGIVHPSRRVAYFDDGDDMDQVDVIDDVLDFVDNDSHSLRLQPEEVPQEDPAPEPSLTPSEPEQEQ